MAIMLNLMKLAVMLLCLHQTNGVKEPTTAQEVKMMQQQKPTMQQPIQKMQQHVPIMQQHAQNMQHHVPTMPEMIQRLHQHVTTAQRSHDIYSELSNLDLHAILSEPRHIESLHSVLTNSNEVIPSACANDTALMLGALLQKQSWAMGFIDAVGKLPSGVLGGDIAWLGGFSQCRRIDVPMIQNNMTGTLYRGQYCLAFIGNKSVPFTPQNAAQMLRLGVCVPDSCNGYETAYMIDTLFELTRVLSAYGALWVDCKPNEKPPLTSGTIAVIILLCILGAFIVGGTCYDMFIHQPHVAAFEKQAAINELSPTRTDDDVQDFPVESGMLGNTPLIGHQGETLTNTVTEPRPGMVAQVFLCFSVIANGSKILSVKQDGQALGAIHGIRFISMSWVMLGHSIVFITYIAMKNPIVILDYMKRFSFQAILNASVSVDSFFLLSGTLVSYLLLNQLQKADGPRNVNWAVIYFHRFWRLTPAYMMIIGMYTTLLHYMGSGPFYPEVPDAFCTDSWWKNLLYINNFWDMSTMCVGWSWYLANDMQFFIISPLIIIALYKFCVVGFILLCALILMNIIVVWVLIQQHNFPADLGVIDFTNPDTMTEWMTDVYEKPYCRVGVYAVGIALGYLLHRVPSKPKIHPALVVVGWLIAAGCCISVIYGLYGIASGDRVLSHDVNAFYGATHRIAWGLGVSWVIFACCTGYGGPVNTFLSWSALVPLSRLTYMAYLLHPIVMMWVYEVQEQPIFISDVSIAYYFLANLVITYGAAFIFSVILESPMMALEKLILPRKYR